MRAFQILCGVIAVIVIAFARASYGDDASEADIDDGTEPITGEPITPQPGSESRPKDPFALYDNGDPDSIWPYASLTAEEKRIVDRGKLDTQPEVNAAFAAISADIAVQAKAHAAEIQLGLQTSPGEIGVVP